MKEKRSRRPVYLILLALVLVTFAAAMVAVPAPSVERVEESLQAEAFLR